MTPRKRWRPPWPLQLLGTAGALVLLGFAADGFGRLLIAAAGMAGVR